MPIVTYTPMRDGDSIDADSLNDRFSDIQAGINDLPESAVGPGAFNEYHLPSFVVSSPSKSFGSTAHEYDGSKALYQTYDWATINEDGDHISGGATAGKDLEVSFGSNLVLSSTGAIGGILVICDIHIKRIVYNSGAAPGHGPAAFFRIQARMSGKPWEAIPRSERFMSSQAYQGDEQWYRVPIRVLIKPDDLSTGPYVESIRAQISVGGGATSGTTMAVVFLRECALSALALKSTLST